MTNRQSNTLSRRELEVLQGIATGQTTIQIAGQLGLSPKTVDTYRSRLMKKLDKHSIAELTVYAIQEKLIRI